MTTFITYAMEMQWWMQRCSTWYIYTHDRQSYAEVLRHLPRLIAPATVTLECAVVVLGRVRVLQWFTGPWRIVRLRDSTRRLLWGSMRGWHGAVLTTHRNWSKLRNSLFHIVYKTCRCKYTRNYDTPNRSVLIETFEYVTSLCMWWILNGWTYELFVFVQHYNMVELSNMVHSIFIFHWWINNQISNMYIIGNQISYTP